MKWGKGLLGYEMVGTCFISPLSAGLTIVSTPANIKDKIQLIPEKRDGLIICYIPKRRVERMLMASSLCHVRIINTPATAIVIGKNMLINHIRFIVNIFI